MGGYVMRFVSFFFLISFLLSMMNGPLFKLLFSKVLNEL